MNFDPGLKLIGIDEVDRVLDVAATDAVHVYVMSVREPADVAEFFAAIEATLPLDPAGLGSGGWDALSDSLWEGLRAMSVARIAIIWRDAYIMRRLNPDDYRFAVEVLEDVANTLADVELTVGSPRFVSLFVVATTPQVTIGPR